MKKIYFLFFALSFLFISRSFAQIAVSDSVPLDKFTAGVGGGYDYGGYGVNATYYLQRSIGIFGGLGYAVAGLGYNVGVKLRANSHKSASRVTPFLLGMYGYYAWAAPKHNPYWNKLFYGPTVGAGFDYRFKKIKFGYLTGAALVPIRDDQAQRYIDYTLNGSQGFNYSHKLHAVNVSLGIKFIIF